MSNRSYWARVVILGLVVGLGLQFAQAWTAPTASAPGGNVSGPITTSGVAQNKQGILGLGGLGVTGAANLNGVTTVGGAGTLKFSGKSTCDLKLDASGNAVCGVADGDVTGVTAGTGLQGGGTSGDITLNANTSYLQRRVTGTCSAGNSIRAIAENGTVTCEPDDGGVDATTLASTLIGRSRLYSCNRDADVAGGKSGTLPCPIPPGSPAVQVCMLERTYASDGGNDVNGFGCEVRLSAGSWTIYSTAIEVQDVQCRARCFY